MRRAHCHSLDLEAVLAHGEFPLDDAMVNRFVRVLRLTSGERVEIFGNGARLSGSLALEGAPKLVDLTRLESTLELPALCIAQAMTKTSKLEDVVRRAAELGAAEVFLFVAARTQGRPKDDKRTHAMVERLARIAEDASRQSGRSEVCAITGPATFSELVARVASDTQVAAFGALHAEQTLSNHLVTRRDRLIDQGMLTVIGPEGGLTPEECTSLAKAGACGVRLAAHTLRTETASLAALSAAQVALGTL